MIPSGQGLGPGAFLQYEGRPHHGEQGRRETGVQDGREQPPADCTPEGRAMHRCVPSSACASWVGGTFASLCCSPALGSSVSKPSPRECPPAHPHPDKAITGRCRRCCPSCPPAHHPRLLAPTSHGGGGNWEWRGRWVPAPKDTTSHTGVLRSPASEQWAPWHQRKPQSWWLE